jgi:hypothetical protein
MKLALVSLLPVCLGLVQLDFERVRSTNSQNAHRLIKRHGTADLKVSFENYVYVADLEVGSDKNKISVLIDTSSSDTAFPVSDVLCFAGEEEEEEGAELFTASSGNHVRHDDHDHDHDHEGEEDEEPTFATTCTDHGSFATGKSSSWKASDDFYVNPHDSEYYYFGVYGSDTVYLNDEKVENVTLVALNETNAPYGLLGLGMSSTNGIYDDESDHENDHHEDADHDDDPEDHKDTPVFPSFIDILSSQGLIKKKLFSLYLNHPSTLTGSVLFGGVDYAKVDGSLTTVPMLDAKDLSGYQVLLSGIDLVIGDKSYGMSKASYPALIYTTGPLSTLPESVYQNLGMSLNGTLNTESLYFIDCPADDDSTKVTFDFSGAKIEVPLGDLVIPNEEGDRCLLGVFPSPQVILGQNILRSAYVVFDIENSEVSLGQVKYSDDTKISTISESIPSAISATATATATKNSTSEIVATSALSYATGIKSFNSVDALFVSELFRENAPASGSAVASGNVKPSGSNASKTNDSGMSTGSSDAASSSAPKSSSSQADASSSVLRFSFILSTVFAGMLVVL